MGIALRGWHRNLDPVGRLLSHSGRQEIKSTDQHDEDDDENGNAGHGGAFAERTSRCIAPSRIWNWGSVSIARWFSSGSWG